MLRKFLPDEHATSVFQIRPEILQQKAIKGVIVDLDNTLVEWHRNEPTPELMAWFQSMASHDIQVMIVSNNTEKRVKHFSQPAQVPSIYKAKKPLTKAFRQALKDMAVETDDIVIIGDQLLTDVLGCNRLGAHTILVDPIVASDSWYTKLNRRVEQVIMAWMKKKGMIYWEE